MAPFDHFFCRLLPQQVLQTLGFHFAFVLDLQSLLRDFSLFVDHMTVEGFGSQYLHESGRDSRERMTVVVEEGGVAPFVFLHLESA